MAYIKIDQIQEYTDKLKNWQKIKESPARECLVIQFNENKTDSIVIDNETANKTLYFQSRNGNVCIEFDHTGVIINIEIT